MAEGDGSASSPRAPLAIAYALTVGAVLYGLAGAVVAVPLAAVVFAAGAHLASRDRRPRTVDRKQP